MTAAKLAADAKTPAGAVMQYAGATVPSGWLECDGSPISRSTYAALFTAIGTTYGIGDGTTTFNVPDARGRSPLGAGTGSGLTVRTLGDKAGTETHTLTGPQSGIAAHAHDAWDGAPKWVYGGANTGTAGDYAHIQGVDVSNIVTDTTGPTTAAESHPNMSPFIVFKMIIKT